MSVRVDLLTRSAQPVVIGFSGCSIFLEWKTELACRACTLADYDKIETPCRPTGHATVYRVKNSTCNGPDLPPETVPCGMCPRPLVSCLVS